MFAVQGCVKNYAWGALASEENAVSLFAASAGEEPPSADTRMAELWLGAHASGSAMARPATRPTDAPKSLENMLAAQKIVMPFLLKVLSVRAPLSLQVHPDRNAAAKLHESDPDHYSDPFDKPEMCLPLHDGFEMLCGFRKPREICLLAQVVPLIRHLIVQMVEHSSGANQQPEPLENVDTGATSAGVTSHEESPPVDSTAASPREPAAAPNAAAPLSTDEPCKKSHDPLARALTHFSEAEFLKKLMRAFYDAPQSLIETSIAETLKIDPAALDYKRGIKVYQKAGTASAIKGLLTNILPVNASHWSPAEVENVVRTALATFRYCHQHFPKDRGCFAAFLLVKHVLNKYEPHVIGTNTMHAYLKGDCVEVMKCSDNVIRAGLTSKHQDVEALLNNLKFSKYLPVQNKISSVGKSPLSAHMITPENTTAFAMCLVKLHKSAQPATRMSAEALYDKFPKKTREMRLTEVLCLSGEAELESTSGEKIQLKHGECYLFIDSELKSVSALSAVAENDNADSACSFIIVKGCPDAEYEPKRRTSVTAAKFVEDSVVTEDD